MTENPHRPYTVPSLPIIGTVSRIACSMVPGKVTNAVVRQLRSMGGTALLKCSAKPGKSDKSNSCAHFRWGITWCNRPTSAIPR